MPKSSKGDLGRATRASTLAFKKNPCIFCLFVRCFFQGNSLKVADFEKLKDENIPSREMV